MRNILLELAFVGTNYCGWQRQKNGTAVQEVLESAIAQVAGERVALIGCSRTDAGVHAEEYVANFKTAAAIPPERFGAAIQTKLPRDIQIIKSKEVELSFNSRRNAYEKTYRYQIYRGHSPFYAGRWWQYADAIDYSLLPELAGLIGGRHDFSGFCVQRSLKQDNHCVVKQAAWRKEGKKLYFKIAADRFLHRMVRFLVGAQIQVATGKFSSSDFEMMLFHAQGKRALYPAPPDGLYLMKVSYR